MTFQFDYTLEELATNQYPQLLTDELCESLEEGRHTAHNILMFIWAKNYLNDGIWTTVDEITKLFSPPVNEVKSAIKILEQVGFIPVGVIK